MADARIEPPTSRGPLYGVRVLDFSQVIAGPVCGANLADLDADVIKVEPPGGESQRRNGSVVPGESKLFQTLNRGKRSLVVDLQTAEGRAVVHRLMPSIDVVVVNYRLGVVERLGIDYETLRSLKPDLIYVESTGWGDRGPQAFQGASDVAVQGYSGLMAGNGKVDDAGAPREIGGVALADYITAVGTSMGVCAALYHRERTGRGQKVSGSLLRSALFMQGPTVMREPITDRTMRDPTMERINELRAAGATYEEIIAAREERHALGTTFALYYSGYRVEDGAIILGALTKPNRDAIRSVLGIEEENSDDPDYDSLDPENIASAAEWKRIIREKFLGGTVAYWIDALQSVGVPVAPVNLPEEVADDSQVLEDGMMCEVTHELTGPQRIVAPLVKLSDAPAAVRAPSPVLGSHTSEVLREAGYSAEEIESLIGSGAVEVAT
ncbi:MAG: CoA transferase [Chloroflexi bacterium]|nr:CoA transferase [Chloroflexota bacterium]